MSETAPPAIATAYLLPVREGGEKRLRALCDRLGELDITVAVVSSPKDGAAQLVVGSPEELVLVIVEAPAPPAGSRMATPEQVRAMGETVAGLAGTMPNVGVIVAAPDPPTELVIAAMRAGADDFIDLATDTKGTITAMIERLQHDLGERVAHRGRVDALRRILEEFLRDLIQTERRSIDLEHQLKVKDRPRHELTGDLDTEREPVVVIVEDDREVADMLVDELEEVGVATYAYTTGEDAIEGVRKLVKKGDAIDLALVDQVLPGMNGLEAIAGMREHRPWLAAFLMTGHSDNSIAQHAADLGVVGFVLKPFDDVAGLIERLREQSLHFRDQARDKTYLDRIKSRHEKVLTRYRALAAELDDNG